MAKGKTTVALVTELAEPLADQMGLLLWDVRFEKEGTLWYLRFFIDKEGGITIDDCEAFSRAIEAKLDEIDPISQSYTLEVGSPGIERELVQDWHFHQYLGELVSVRMIRPLDGVRDFTGELAGFEDHTITLLLPEDGRALRIARADTAYVKLYDDYVIGGLDT